MKEVRIGIIGVGNIGFMHATNIYENRVQGMRLTAVCDVREWRLDICRRKFAEIRCYQDYTALMESGETDAVLIAVPHRFHGQIAIEALQAGLHVLVEKPIDITVAKAQKLICAAQQSDRVFAIMFNQRTNMLFQKARNIVRGGQLGELKRTVWIITNWYRSQHYYDSGDWRATWRGEGGGVLLNQCPHQLDLWQWICGLPTSVTSFCNVAKYHHIEVEDEATIYARYKNGATGLFITSTGEYPGTNRLEISGDKGKLVLEDAALKWWRLAQSEPEVRYSSNESSPEIASEYQEFQQAKKETGHIGILQNFTNAILYGEELLSPGVEGIYELMISNAAYLSEWSGNQEITIPFDNEQFDRMLAEHSTCPIEKRCAATADIYQDSKRWQVRW